MGERQHHSAIFTENIWWKTPIRQENINHASRSSTTGNFWFHQIHIVVHIILYIFFFIFKFIEYSYTGNPLITRPPIARISLQHGFSKIWTPLVTLGVLPAARFLQYIFIDFYNIFMKLTIPPIARISHSTDFSCSQKTVLWEDFLYQKNFQPLTVPKSEDRGCIKMPYDFFVYICYYKLTNSWLRKKKTIVWNDRLIKTNENV